jgi:hypothetical protein
MLADRVTFLKAAGKTFCYNPMPRFAAGVK